MGCCGSKKKNPYQEIIHQNQNPIPQRKYSKDSKQFDTSSQKQRQKEIAKKKRAERIHQIKQKPLHIQTNIFDIADRSGKKKNSQISQLKNQSFHLKIQKIEASNQDTIVQIQKNKQNQNIQTNIKKKTSDHSKESKIQNFTTIKQTNIDEINLSNYDIISNSNSGKTKIQKNDKAVSYVIDEEFSCIKVPQVKCYSFKNNMIYTGSN